MEPSELVDAVLEIGNQRRQILLKMREAVKKKDLQTVFECAEELVGLAECHPPAKPKSHEKSN
ncbi:MAG: hypothetical protein LAN84_00170 [Acidobacteriia bacterium]|nr:hypothetical protein [Terriglobia bacterium]